MTSIFRMGPQKIQSIRERFTASLASFTRVKQAAPIVTWLPRVWWKSNLGGVNLHKQANNALAQRFAQARHLLSNGENSSDWSVLPRRVHFGRIDHVAYRSNHFLLTVSCDKVDRTGSQQLLFKTNTLLLLLSYQSTTTLIKKKLLRCPKLLDSYTF